MTKENKTAYAAAIAAIAATAYAGAGTADIAAAAAYAYATTYATVALAVAIAVAISYAADVAVAVAYATDVALDLKREELKTMEEKPKVYVFTIFPHTYPVRGWCCDRLYNYMDDESWKQVKIGDIICGETSLTSYFDPPPWAKELLTPEKFTTFWTNYYE